MIEESEDWAEPRQEFITVPAVAGHGRLWLYDAGLALLVTVDGHGGRRVDRAQGGPRHRHHELG